MQKIFIVFFTSLFIGIFIWLTIANYDDVSMSKTPFSQQEPLDLEEYWEVYDIIEDDYYGSGAIEKQELVYGSIEWLVESLWDKHSEFMDPEVTKKFEETLTGDFEGIGAVVEKHPLWVKVDRILKGSPAKASDIRSGDVIIQADTYELDDMDLYDAVEKIKGPADSQVVLTILRPGEDQVLEKNVTRQKIHIPSVEHEYFSDGTSEGKIGYISLNMYGETTAQEFRKALEEIQQSWATWLIIDVRDNGGWYLQSAVEILSHFIPSGEILVETRHKDSYFNQDYYSINTGNIFDENIVVLINGNSASASEITAGTLREYDKAILVGEKTYGKWSVQQPFEMDDGSTLKLTIAKWFTPKWVNIDEEGIEPDIEIVFEEEDYEQEYDRQLEEAKNILKIFDEKDSIWLTIEEYQKQQTDTNNLLEE